MLAVCLVIAAVVVFHWHLISGGSLQGGDWSWVRQPYEWIHTSLTRYATVPLYMHGMRFSPNLLANPQSPLLGPLVGFLAVLPADPYIKLTLVFYSTIGLLGMYALLRELGVAPPIAGVLATIFTFNGFFVSHFSVGHPMVMGSYLLPLIVLCMRRAASGSTVLLWCAAGLNTCTAFEGQNHPFIWNNVFLALYAASWAFATRSLAPVKTWVLFSVASVGLGAVKLLPMSAEFASYSSWQFFYTSRRFQGFPPASVLWSLVVPGQDQSTAAYSGLEWWEFDFYIGGIAFLLLAAGLAAGARRGWTWIGAGAVFLVLAIDFTPWKPVPDLWSMIRDLPLWRSQRVPSRFLIVALTAFLVAAGIGLQSVWDRALARWRRPRLLWVVAAVTLAAVYGDLYVAARPWEQLAVGPEAAVLDHRFGVPSERGVTLKDFRPNRLVYEVDAAGPTRFLLPIPNPSGQLEWQPVGFEADARDRALLVSVPAGTHEIVVAYRPRHLWLGVGLSTATVIGALAWEVRRRRRTGA